MEGMENQVIGREPKVPNVSVRHLRVRDVMIGQRKENPESGSADISISSFPRAGPS